MIHAMFSPPGQPELQVQVIAASISPDGIPIYTIRMRYPRIIHSEVMTHRQFSRNARSSRAVPVQTMLDEILNRPFIPWHWGKNQKGMQAGEEITSLVECYPLENGEVLFDERPPQDAWLLARDYAISAARGFSQAGYHKQLVNRLLEPFMWIDTLVTSTQWNNFLWLRDHKDAEPHLQDLARLVDQAITDASHTIMELTYRQWHLPYIAGPDFDYAFSRGDHQSAVSWLCKISAARCARISYSPFDGDGSYEREIERYNSLVSSDRIHASPLEHQATPDHTVIGPDGDPQWDSFDDQGNLHGWIQYRKLIPQECR